MYSIRQYNTLHHSLVQYSIVQYSVRRFILIYWRVWRTKGGGNGRSSTRTNEKKKLQKSNIVIDMIISNQKREVRK